MGFPWRSGWSRTCCCPFMQSQGHSTPPLLPTVRCLQVTRDLDCQRHSWARVLRLPDMASTLPSFDPIKEHLVNICVRLPAEASLCVSGSHTFLLLFCGSSSLPKRSPDSHASHRWSYSYRNQNGIPFWLLQRCYSKSRMEFTPLYNQSPSLLSWDSV